METISVSSSLIKYKKCFTWVPANLSYLPDNDILILSYDGVNAMHLSYPTINTTFGTFLPPGHIYYKGPS